MAHYVVTCCESFDHATSPEDAAISLVRVLRDPHLSCVALSVSNQDGTLYDVDVFTDERTGEPCCDTTTTEEFAL